MSLHLCHESATQYWLTKTGDELVPDYVPVRNLANATASMKEVAAAGLPVDYSAKRPLHVLVGTRQDYRSLKSVKTHVWSGSVPPGSFNELYGANFVSSPEFTFLQMASVRPQLELVELGCHLCSKFSIGAEGHGYVGERAPLTTPERMALFLEAANGAYGVAKARRALCYVVPGAASPMEILIVLACVLPPRLGGWSMPEITANQSIRVDDDLKLIVESDYLVGDIYLPSVRGDIEYDSYEFHTGRYRLDHTQARRNVLEAMDVKTVSATWGQISSFDKFEAFMRMVMRRFGIEGRAFTAGERVAQINLYEHLTDPRARLF